MQHLLEYLSSYEKAADYFRQQRWSDQVCCPHCGSRSIKARERCDNGLQRYHCPNCALEGQQEAIFNDWTRSGERLIATTASITLKNKLVSQI